LKIFILLFLMETSSLMAQEFGVPISVSSSYGLFSFINVDDLSAYNMEKDTKLISLDLRVELDENYSVGLFAAYQKLYLNTKDTQNVFFLERQYYMSRLDKTLLNKKYLELYISALSGVKKEMRHLILGDELKYEPVWEVVLLGLRIKAGKHFSLYGESAYSMAAVVRLGVELSL